MSEQLIWADLGPHRSVLYRVSQDTPLNKKVAEINGDPRDGRFTSTIYEGRYGNHVTLGLSDKQAAMERVIAAMVLRRFDQAD